jgi:hypothetical protein
MTSTRAIKASEPTRADPSTALHEGPTAPDEAATAPQRIATTLRSRAEQVADELAAEEAENAGG